MNKNLEILAPVGSLESLKAAVLNGANAVYLGGKLFNARHYASNFSDEELMEAVSYAHLRDVRVYVTVNILLDESEIEDALDYVKFLYQIGVDAIIVQDLGFAMLVKRLIPKMPLHASTQMTVNNLEGVKHLEELGFSKVVLARETPIDEIKYIKENSNVDLEGFIHGALCISYSGQCLMSSLIGGRSGNRGTCAQPCRMEYTVLDDKNHELSNWDSGYYLSTKDLNTIEHIKDIINAGIVSLKIEGRMKRPEYVATVVKTYRKALDLGSEFVTQEERNDVKQIFNREFTKGMGLGDFGRDFLSTDRPDNRGIVIGKIISSNRNETRIEIYSNLYSGDGLEWIDPNKKTTGFKLDKDYKIGEKVILQFAPEGMIGSEVRRTLSSSLLEKAKATYENVDKKYSIYLDVKIKIGELPTIIAQMNDFRVESVGDQVVQMANKAPVSREKVIEQLSKFGNTVFSLDSLDLDFEEGAFIPVSKLNELRRDAAGKLEEVILSKYRRDKIDLENYEVEKNSLLKKQAIKPNGLKLSLRVSNQNQFDQIDLTRAHRVYLAFSENLSSNITLLKKHGIEVYYWTDKILYSYDLVKMLEIVKPVESLLDGISVSNIGTLQFAKDNFRLKIHTDIGLNTFNSSTADYLIDIGTESITLSSELNLKQIKIIANSINTSVEGIVYGYLPSMIMKNCPMATFKGCKDDSQCSTCKFAHGYKLKDRMGKAFLMERYDGYSTIYNSVPIFLLDKIHDITKSGLSMLRLDFTVEEDIREIQRYYYDAIYKKTTKESLNAFIDSYKENQEVTNGHYYRGVL